MKNKRRYNDNVCVPQRNFVKFSGAGLSVTLSGGAIKQGDHHMTGNQNAYVHFQLQLEVL